MGDSSVYVSLNESLTLIVSHCWLIRTFGLAGMVRDVIALYYRSGYRVWADWFSKAVAIIWVSIELVDNFSD